VAPHWSRHVSDGRRFRRRGFDAWGIEKTEMGSYLDGDKKGASQLPHTYPSSAKDGRSYLAKKRFL